jgi:hypothetical protein
MDRKSHNEDLIRRMKAGDALQYNATSTWFPPRPLIKKDKKIVKQLYGDTVDIVGEKKTFELKVVKDS